jgi:hypothetical protein
MSDRSARSRIDWGHLALLALLAGVTTWYLHDAWSASSRVRNLILILPASILAVTLAAGIAVGVIVQCLRAPDDRGAVVAQDTSTLSDRLYPLILMTIFALYILTIPVAGFDFGSALFVLIALIFDGERRPLFLLIYPVLFAAVCTLLFRWLLPYPMTTLIL